MGQATSHFQIQGIKMNKTFISLTVSVFLIGCQTQTQEKASQEIQDNIKFTTSGIDLYDGMFRFESEGELFQLIDSESTVQVPTGAVLSCIRRNYTIGYYPGEVSITDSKASFKIQKIFFILKPSGEITFHRPAIGGHFSPDKLTGQIEWSSRLTSIRHSCFQFE